MKKTSGILFIGLLILTACSSTGRPSAASATATASPQPAATATALPTPSSPGNMVVWENLQVTMDRSEVTEDYLTEYGSTRIPPSGQKFLWIHVRLKNLGQIQMNILGSEHFSVLYAGIELKPTYGHRMDYPDYTVLGPVIFPDQELDAWLRFDIPMAAELKDLRFVFLPASSQIGVSPLSPNYPYAEDKPIYVWKCGS